MPFALVIIAKNILHYWYHHMHAAIVQLALPMGQWMVLPNTTPATNHSNTLQSMTTTYYSNRFLQYGQG